MPKLSTKLARAVPLVPLLLLCLCPTPKAGASTCDDPYSVAISLIRALYPELSGKGANVDIQTRYPLDASGPLLSFYIQVSASDQIACCVDARSPNPSSAERVGQFSAHFQFDGRDQRIFSVFTTGSFVNDDKQRTIARLVDDHPEWSDGQITNALLQAGAKFGPDHKQELLAKFPAKGLEPILGSIEMDEAQFVFRVQNGAGQAATLDWSLRFRATRGAKHDEYTASLEPFQGKLVTLGRRSLD